MVSKKHALLIASPYGHLIGQTSETAWEHETPKATGRKLGVLTEALVDWLEVSRGLALPWRIIILRVKELVTVHVK